MHRMSSISRRSASAAVRQQSRRRNERVAGKQLCWARGLAGQQLHLSGYDGCTLPWHNLGCEADSPAVKVTPLTASNDAMQCTHGLACSENAPDRCDQLRYQGVKVSSTILGREKVLRGAGLQVSSAESMNFARRGRRQGRLTAADGRGPPQYWIRKRSKGPSRAAGVCGKARSYEASAGATMASRMSASFEETVKDEQAALLWPRRKCTVAINSTIHMHPIVPSSPSFTEEI